MKCVKAVLLVSSAIFVLACQSNKEIDTMNDKKIIFLHHSTGNGVWKGNPNKYIYKLNKVGDVQKLIKKHNKENHTNFVIEERAYPQKAPYGWENYPYDYYNIWIKNSGDKPFKEEPTLDMLAKEYDVIIFKHCFPVSNIKADADTSDINSSDRTIGNYKLQYEALKKKMQEFPDIKFIVWTGAALVAAHTNEDEAKRAMEFSDWVKTNWGADDDNIFVWDFRELETEGGAYLKEEYAVSSTNSHPNRVFNAMAAKLFAKRLVDIIENDGKGTNLVGRNN